MPGRLQLFIPPEGPPQESPSKEIYHRMGEAHIFRMLEDFYLELEQSSIRYLFPEDMRQASRKSAMFFVFLLGGPPLYQEKYGQPMMRQRHLPFVIDEQARQVWFDCFKKILINAEEKYSFPKEHLEGFIQFLDRFSRWMINKKHD